MPSSSNRHPFRTAMLVLPRLLVGPMIGVLSPSSHVEDAMNQPVEARNEVWNDWNHQVAADENSQLLVDLKDDDLLLIGGGFSRENNPGLSTY